MPFLSLSWALALVLAPSTPAPVPLHQQIDVLIAAGLPPDLPTAQFTDDAGFLRRVSLDLIGRIPSAAETRAFLADDSPDKRARLVEELLHRPEHARHLAQVWDVLLLDRRRSKRISAGAWHEYLRAAFAANQPWDELIRSLLVADGADPKQRAAATFLLARDLDTLQLTRDISRLFVGRNIQCAECHDHPVVRDYKQADFYGIQAFLNRSYLFPNAKDNKASIGEKADGEVSFSDVFDETKTVLSTPPRLPDRRPIVDPKLAKDQAYQTAPNKKTRGIPSYSRREQLAKQLTAGDYQPFARTTVNRFWALLMGRGLVHPLDQDASDNPPSHPELLEQLTRDFQQHGFNVRRLIRAIVLSKTYQRSSILPAGAEDLPADRFAVAALKPLSPEQLAWSVLEATGQIEIQRQALGDKAPEAAVYKKLAGNIRAFARTFGNPAGQPVGDGFEATLEQTLFLKHGPAIRNWLKPRKYSLTGRLRQLDTPAAIAEELFLAVLTRKPTPDEQSIVADVLAEHADHRDQALAELAWALLASAEFRFNH